MLHPGSRCLGLGEAFEEIALGEEEIKAKITMKQLRDCRLGGGERWREPGGVERREGRGSARKKAGENKRSRKGGLGAWFSDF